MNNYMVIAPDTDSGKTVITAALVANGKKKIGKITPMKPIQSGALIENGKRLSPDLQEIEKLSGVTLDDSKYFHLCNYNLLMASSPHLAAKKEMVDIQIDVITKSFHTLTMSYRGIIVESAGGIMSPISHSKTNLDLLQELNIPAIIVLRNRLGIISSALSTITLCKERNIEIAGVVMVSEEKTGIEKEIQDDNISIIKEMGGAEVFDVPFVDNLEEDFFIVEEALKDLSSSLFTLENVVCSH